MSLRMTEKQLAKYAKKHAPDCALDRVARRRQTIKRPNQPEQKAEWEKREAMMPAFKPQHRDIQLPWPHESLSPNSRSDWRIHADAAKDAREAGFWATKEQKLTKASFDLSKPIKLTFFFFRKYRHKLDNDNASASCKAYRDGIAQALGIDDQHIESTAVIVRDLGHKVVARLYQ